MLNIPQLLATELNLKAYQVQNALELLAEGATIPFIARYRKERTGEMNEVQLRELADRHTYLTELEERKSVILNAIAEQGKLTDELKAKIEACLQKTELEDLYLPFRPKRRTRATVAREKGLEPLAEFIKSLNTKNAAPANLEPEAAKYISEEKGVKTAQEALKGASDILAEEVAEKAELRAYLREYLLEEGIFVSRVKDEYPEGTTKFEMYRNYQIKVKNIAPHNLLALCRGENEQVLSFDISFDEDMVLSYLESQEIRSKHRPIRNFY
ncbi:RNA-binding transcriptional accessory protein, partial [Fischerella thermalis CCMEE 5328]